MLQYINAFFCTYNDSQGSFVIRLRQTEPVENAEDDSVNIITNEITSIIMDKESAQNLADAIYGLLGKNNDSEISE